MLLTKAAVVLPKRHWFVRIFGRLVILDFFTQLWELTWIKTDKVVVFHPIVTACMSSSSQLIHTHTLLESVNHEGATTKATEAV